MGSLGAVIAIFSGIKYFQEKMLGKPETVIRSLRYHFIMTFFGILLTFVPMHFLGFNVMPRRISDFPNYFNSNGPDLLTNRNEMSIITRYFQYLYLKVIL